MNEYTAVRCLKTPCKSRLIFRAFAQTLYLDSPPGSCGSNNPTEYSPDQRCARQCCQYGWAAGLLCPLFVCLSVVRQCRTICAHKHTCSTTMSHDIRSNRGMQCASLSTRYRRSVSSKDYAAGVLRCESRHMAGSVKHVR